MVVVYFRCSVLSTLLIVIRLLCLPNSFVSLLLLILFNVVFGCFVSSPPLIADLFISQPT